MGTSAYVRFVNVTLLVVFGLVPLSAQERSVLQLAGGGASADISALVLSLRAIGQIRHVEADATQTSIQVSGTSDEIALAKWLVDALDRPEGAPRPKDSTQSEYPLPDGSGQLVKVFYLSHTSSPEDQMDMVKAIRSMGDVRMILPYTRQRAISMRGPESEVHFAIWLIGELDQPVKGPSTRLAKWRDYPVVLGGDVVRLFHLPDGPVREEVTGNLAAMAEATGVRRLFPIAGRGVLVARGKPEQLESLKRVIYQAQ